MVRRGAGWLGTGVEERKSGEKELAEIRTLHRYAAAVCTVVDGEDVSFRRPALWTSGDDDDPLCSRIPRFLVWLEVSDPSMVQQGVSGRRARHAGLRRHRQAHGDHRVHDEAAFGRPRSPTGPPWRRQGRWCLLLVLAITAHGG